MENSYHFTGFQSPCAEFSEKPLSLDERYLRNRPALFIIEVAVDSENLGIKKGDKFLVDRSKIPKEGALSIMVIQNEFRIMKYSKKLLMGEDPETGNFLWGVVTTLIREYL